MPVEAVELVPGEDLQEALDLGRRVELPRHVEMDAAPAERRLVVDFAGGRKQEGFGVMARAAQDLAERDQAVEQAIARAGRNRDAVARKPDRVGLGAEAVAERYDDRESALGGRANDALDGKQTIDQLVEGFDRRDRLVAFGTQIEPGRHREAAARRRHDAATARWRPAPAPRPAPDRSRRRA